MTDPTIATLSKHKYQFLSGGGEMGELMRTKDWSDTHVGNPDHWPQSLRTALSIILHARSPMFLWWGSELTCFYNDAYRPSLGNDGKHPGILGKPAEKAWTEIWHIIKPLIDQVLAGGEAPYFEDTLVPIYRNGKIEDVYWTFSFSAVRDESGKIGGIFVNCVETTDKVLNEKKVIYGEQKFKNLINESPIATAVFTGEDFVVELANEEALKLWGKKENVLGKKIIAAMPELEGQPYMDLLKNVYTSGETYYGNENLVQIEVDGKIVPTYVNFIYKALRDPDDKIYGILTMGYNVTEQVETRKKIEYSNENSRLAVDTAMLGTIDLTWPEKKFTCSKRVYEIFGFPDSTPPYEELFSHIHPDDIHIREEANKLGRVTGKIDYEVRILWPDKTIHWITAYGKVFYGEDKNPVRVLATIRDITDQKNFLDNIQISEKKFRNTVTQAPVGIAILRGRDFLVEMANKNYLELIDRKEEDFVGKKLFDVIPEVRESVESLLVSVIETGKEVTATEFAIPVKRKGVVNIGYFNFAYQALREEDNTISGVIVTVNEVTSLVKGKYLLAESERQFRNVIMQSPIPMTIFRGEDHIIEMANTEMFTNIWRKEEKDVIGKRLFDVFPELKDQKYPPLLKNVLSTGQPYREKESVVYIQGDDGLKKFYLDYEYSPLLETDGTISGIMITVNDVTQRVMAKQKIEIEEARLRLAIEGTKLATWDLNLETKSIIHSPRLAEIFGHPLTTQITHQHMRDQIHPDDRQSIVERAFDMAMETGYYNYEARVVRPDKTIGWIKTQGKVMYDEQGTPIRLIGTLADTTENKIAEEKVAMLAAIVESSEDVIISKTLDGIITSWNAGAQRVFGYEGAEIIGQHITKLIPLDRFDEEPQILRRIQHGESVDHFETQRITKEGNLLDISLTISPIKDTAGNIIGASKIARDITKQKQIERLVAESELRLNIAIQAAELGTWEFDIKNQQAIYSSRYLEIFGYKDSEEPSHNSLLERIHRDDLDMRNKALQDAIESGFLNLEMRIVTIANDLRWIQAKGKVFYDDNNIATKIMGTIMDVTDERQAELAIRESEGKFRLLSDAMPQFIWTSDPQGNLIYFNQAVYDYSGLTEEEAMNGGWVQIIHPDDKQENIKKWMHSITTGEDFVFEHRFRKYNGEYRWQLSRAIPHRDSSGNIQMWIGTSTDIHDSKLYSDKLQKSELLFKTISNAPPVGLWMTDNKGQNVFVNQTWINWTGMPLEEHYGQGWLSRVVEEDKAAVPSFENAMKRREKYTTEFRLLKPDNEIRWCLIEGYPFYNMDGEFEGYAGSVTDITDIKKLEQQKDFFISMASHELKTPITSIKGYVQILLSMHKDSPDTFLKSSLTTVNKQIGTLTKLIADLLDMSKIKSGNLQLNKEEFSMNEMIRETIDEIKHTQPGHDIMFTPERESVVYADRLRIAQVLINFLTNAIKYSPHFNMVTVKVSIVENNVIVAVIDSGIGINKNDQEKIFQRFYRVEGKDEKTFPGFGIGLFIASEIIQRHNGKIGVESEPGKGSVFSFSLPLEDKL
ncbi:MAG TPA: PAS domain S-box protein [Ferruginibacter sp.]|nr:PAS domain S-box protein [Ferruginibacter sp.]